VRLRPASAPNRAQTVLVSLMLANNEVGSLNVRKRGFAEASACE
jgi:hypothetical protein